MYMITVREAAEKFQVPWKTIHYWVEQNKVRHVQAGKGGDSKRSARGGRLVYHTLVEHSDTAAQALNYHKRVEAGQFNAGSNRYVLTAKHVYSPRKSPLRKVNPKKFEETYIKAA